MAHLPSRWRSQAHSGRLTRQFLGLVGAPSLSADAVIPARPGGTPPEQRRGGCWDGAYLNLDQISFCRPEPDEDTDNHRIKMSNVGAT